MIQRAAASASSEAAFLRRYVGEWYHPEEGRGSPTQDQIDLASGNCFIVMAIYIGFTVMAIACLYWQKSRAAKRSAA